MDHQKLVMSSISGMSSQESALNILAAIRRLEGIRRVRPRRRRRRVAVVFDRDVIAPEEIVRAVNRAAGGAVAS